MSYFNKLGLVDYIVTSTGTVFQSNISGNASARIVISNAAAGNTLTIAGRITGQESFETIYTLTGNQSKLLNFSSYDLIKITCTVFSSSVAPAKVVINLSGFETQIIIDDNTTTTTETWSSTKIRNELNVIGDIYVRSTRFITISAGTSGTITLPAEQAIILDDFGGTVDAIVTTISGGRPTDIPARNAANTIIAATLDINGNWTITDTPSSYPIALIYRVRQQFDTYIDTDSNMVGSAYLDRVTSVNSRTGDVVVTKADVGLGNADNTSDVNKPISTATQTALDAKVDDPLGTDANGSALIVNSAQPNKVEWVPAVVAAAPFTYTLATRTLTAATANTTTTGFLTSTDWNTFNNKAPTNIPVFTGDVNSSTGNILVSTLGKGIHVKTGTNSKIGTATMVAGTVTVANTSVTSNSLIFLTTQVVSGTAGDVRISAKNVGIGFTITGGTLDNSTVAWYIVEVIP